MNSNKYEIYELTRFQLHMHAVKITEQVHDMFSSINSGMSTTD